MKIQLKLSEIYPGQYPVKFDVKKLNGVYVASCNKFRPTCEIDNDVTIAMQKLAYKFGVKLAYAFVGINRYAVIENDGQDYFHGYILDLSKEVKEEIEL